MHKIRCTSFKHWFRSCYTGRFAKKTSSDDSLYTWPHVAASSLQPLRFVISIGTARECGGLVTVNFACWTSKVLPVSAYGLTQCPLQTSAAPAENCETFAFKTAYGSASVNIDGNTPMQTCVILLQACRSPNKARVWPETPLHGSPSGSPRSIFAVYTPVTMAGPR